MIIRAFIVILFNAICFTLFGQIEVKTNRQSCRFEVGEQISFVVTSNSSSNVSYTLQYDKYTPIETGNVYVQAGVPTIINYTANDPTAITCAVNQFGNVRTATATVSPFDIQPFESAPGDFDSFWANQKAQLAAVPLDPVVTPYNNNAYSTTYKVNLAHVDNRRVYGYITIPNGNGYYPAVLTMPSFGQAPNTVVPETTFSEQSNTISMVISIHNADTNQQDINAYSPDNFINRDENYNRLAVLAGIRAIDYLYSRGDVDQSKIGVFGTSQGGGLSMIIAGIDNRVKVCMNTISILCEHAGFKYGRGAGFPYYLHNAIGYQYPQEQTLNSVKYYDAVYAAARFQGPVLMNISYLDNTTPAATNFAAWNQFTGNNKILIHSTRLDHVSPSQMWEDRFKMLRRVWPNATANPLYPYGDTTSKGHWVNAGSNISGQANTAINLNGVVQYNEGTNNSWPVEWGKVSGPGNVNFSNSNNRNTTATFSSNGTYILRFRAEDQQTYAGNNNFITMEDFVQVTIGGSNNNQQNQNITFNSIPDKLTTDNPFNISASASSGLPVSLTIASGPATISGNSITLTGQEGTVIVRANQIGNTSYFPAPQQTQAFQVTTPDNGGGNNSDCQNPTLVSQGKPTNQSSTLNISGISGDASKAVDGNTNGNFWNGSVSACTNSYQPWWQVDLGTTHTIKQIKVWNRTEGNDRLNNFHVMISDTPFSNDLNTALNNSTWTQQTTGQAGTPSTYNLDNTGRYIRIQANGNSYLTLAEVQVYGCSDNGGGNNGCTDSDNDGTCDADDCNIWNPNIPATPGTSCDDYNPNTSNDVYLADGCTCQGTNNGGGGNNGCQDSDNDGTCDIDDCNPWNPNLPATPGTPCDDYDPHNFNDVYLADGCTCQGTDDNTGGGGNNGGNNGCQDSDNDGTCDIDDCNPWNPNLPATPGTPCDDYDPHNFNDVYLADGCTCQGTDDNTGGGGNNGGNNGCQDSDNDGTCDIDDCNPWNPNIPAVPGTPCDDYDPHNFNDVYLADGCTCQGTDDNSGGGNNGGGNNGITYCGGSGNSTSYEYIERVTIGSLENLSGNNYGYGDFTNLTTNGTANSAFLLHLVPGFTGNASSVYWRVWIDFNQDGDFYDPGEYLYQGASNNSVFTYVTIPNSVATGNTRLRIAMKAGSYPSPCENFAYGEVEDYTINLAQSNANRITTEIANTRKFDFTLRPNPVDDFMISDFINKDSAIDLNDIALYNAIGEKIDLNQFDFREEDNRLILYTNSLKSGYYLLSIRHKNEVITKPFIKVK